MEIILNNPIYLNLLWAVAAVAVVAGIALMIRSKALKRFASAGLLKKLAPGASPARRTVKVVLVIASLAAIVVALADIRWGKTWREVPQKGVDVMFVLDVSKSMLAEDATPTRLGRAKGFITDMTDAMGGDRVGLITFAGSVTQKVPLTSNHHDLKILLSEVNPESTPRGGSMLGDAISTAADCFVDKTADHKAIVILSDGEDHGSAPIEIARKTFADKGIRIYTIAIGDSAQGARIPIARTMGGNLYLKYKGQEVWTKMNPKSMEQIALAGNGAYVPAGTSTANMEEIYRRHIGAIRQRKFDQAKINTYITRYQWFAGIALFLLLADTLLSDQKRVKKSRKRKPAKAKQIAQAAQVPANSETESTQTQKTNEVETC